MAFIIILKLYILWVSQRFLEDTSFVNLIKYFPTDSFSSGSKRLLSGSRTLLVV